ncbi:MAG: hypothetical protein WCO78_01465 [Candidatus Roizmanbacteria bacterium]
MDQNVVPKAQNSSPVQERPTTPGAPQVEGNHARSNNGVFIPLLIVGLTVLVMIIAGGGWYVNTRFDKVENIPPVSITPTSVDIPVLISPTLGTAPSPEMYRSILFQDKKVILGDTFHFSPKDSCVEDTVATLSAITKDSVTFKIKELNWKNELARSIEEIKDYTIKDTDCITAPPRCTDVSYAYCFTLANEDSMQRVSYALKIEGTMPQPPATAITSVPAVPAETDAQCKQIGESICINGIICPNNTDKCCKGLMAVIDTKSTATCETPSVENASKPRVQSLEQ